ncbi:MAG: hypothetical protein ACSHX7_00455 [Luteolibacter sp.]
MIPKKKKSAEELAALRENLGIPEVPPPAAPSSATARPTPLPLEITAPEPIPAPAPQEKKEIPSAPAPVLDPIHPDQPPEMELREPLVHLDIPAAPAPSRDYASHSLRKHEPKLAPAPVVTNKTTLPDRRHDADDIARMRKADTISHISGEAPDPAAHLRSMTAHPVLLAIAYLPALASGFLAWRNFHYITPLALLILASILAAYIFKTKKRSRHHSAFLLIIILMTLAFGGLHYAPLFQNAP